MENVDKGQLKSFLRKDGSRWSVLLTDLFLVWSSFILSYNLVFKPKGFISVSLMVGGSGGGTLVYLFIFSCFRPYQIIVWSTGLRDLKLIGNRVPVAFTLAIAFPYLWGFIEVDDLEQKYYFSQMQLLLQGLIAKVNPLDLQEKRKRIDDLCQLVQRANPERDRMQIVGSIKAIVPEFKSQNYIFESLDPLEEPLN